MDIAGGNAAVKQREPLPLAQLVHHVGGHIRQVIQTVACTFQLAHDLHGGPFCLHHGGPLLDAGLHLKYAVGAGGVFQHELVGLLPADDAAVQIEPFLTAEHKRVGLLLGAAVHKVIHQKVLGGKIYNNAAEIKNNIFIHKNLR